MKKRFLSIILPVITMILEILPYGAVCVFAPSPTQRLRETYSYFDPIPFGYANFAPMITGIISCIILLLVVVYCITGKLTWAVKAKHLLYVAAVFSLGPLVYGISFFSLVGALITVSIIAELLLLRAVTKAEPHAYPKI